jgi:hypothetical protein
MRPSWKARFNRDALLCKREPHWQVERFAIDEMTVTPDQAELPPTE